MHTIHKSDPNLKQIDASFVICVTQPIPKPSRGGLFIFQAINTAVESICPLD